MDFSERLKQLRTEKKLTQTDLANILNVKPTAISNYESGRNEPSYEKLEILSNYFNISLDYLLGLSDETFPISGNIVDRDTFEFSNMYHQLDKHNKIEVRNFTQWLIYKQSNNL